MKCLPLRLKADPQITYERTGVPFSRPMDAPTSILPHEWKDVPRLVAGGVSPILVRGVRPGGCRPDANEPLRRLLPRRAA